MSSPSPVVPLHPDVEVLAPLLGTWSGTGEGSYPTIESFSYLEEITFGHNGKPFLSYVQRTRHASDGRPLHAETGYWRVVGQIDGGHQLEVILSHPTGITEILEGRMIGGNIDLASTTIGRSSTAKEVRVTDRRFVLDDESFSYRVAMAAVGKPLTHHLEARLTRPS